MGNQIKLNGFIKSHRRKLKPMSDYFDREYRLLDVLVHIVDWDKKHAAFGVTKESLRDIQRHYLPNWSLGKLCAAMKDLAQRAVIERNSDGKVLIKNFWKFTTDVQPDEHSEDEILETEHPVQQDEQSVHSDEQNVQPSERIDDKQINDVPQKLPTNTVQIDASVQQGEQPDSPKETQKKLIEHQTNNDEMLLMSKLTERYGEDISVPIRNFSPIRVRDAARRMEARIRYKNESVRNKIGCITNLCKENIPWEESDEKKLDDSMKAREAVQKETERRKWEEMNKPISPEQRARNLEALKRMKKELIEKGWKLKP